MFSRSFVATLIATGVDFAFGERSSLSDPPVVTPITFGTLNDESALNEVPSVSQPTIKFSDAPTSIGNSDIERLDRVSPSSLQLSDSNDFLAPLRKAAEDAKKYERHIKEHGFFKSTSPFSLFQGGDETAGDALALGEKALRKLHTDLIAEKEELSNDKKAPSNDAESDRDVLDENSPASFLEVANMDYKFAAAAAIKKARDAEHALEKSKRKTDSLLSKVHDELNHFNANTADTSSGGMAQVSERKTQVDESFIQRTDSSMSDILAPLRQAGEEARHFAEKMRQKIQERLPISLLQTGNAGDRAAMELSMAENALRKVDEEIASKKDALLAEANKLKEGGFNDFGQPASFLQTRSRFDPLSPQALADWRDKFELQLQKAREAAGIHTPMHSSFSQLKDMNFAENDQLKEDERQVERLENQYNQQMQKLKEDNAELLARAKEEMERAKDEENKVKSQLAQTSFIELGEGFDLAKERAHISALEKKWIKNAKSVVSPNLIFKQDKQLKNIIEEQRLKASKAEAKLDEMKQKVKKDMDIIARDLASASSHPSFIQIGEKGPADAALARAEADLQKVKTQLREETAKLNAMHFDA